MTHYDLEYMALEQEMEKLMKHLTTVCDQCLMIDRELKIAQKYNLSDKVITIEDNWHKHITERHKSCL